MLILHLHIHTKKIHFPIFSPKCQKEKKVEIGMGGGSKTNLSGQITWQFEVC